MPLPGPGQILPGGGVSFQDVRWQAWDGDEGVTWLDSAVDGARLRVWAAAAWACKCALPS